MTDPADLLRNAIAQHQAGRTAEAEALYRQILAADPRQADALDMLGVLCLQSGRAAEAVDYLNRALAIRPSQSEYANHLGAAYGALGRNDDAIAVLRRAVQSAPGAAAGHYNLGIALRNQERVAEAAASFRHAVAADPHSAEAHYNLANALRDLHEPAQAEASYREALRLRPGYLKALINLGNTLRDERRYDESIELLSEATRLDPNYPSAHLNLGTVLRDAGRYDEAVDSLRRAVALNPNVAEAHNNLGTALQALARFDEARACYDEALRIDPQLSDAHFSRATSRMRLGDLAGGLAEYEWRWKCKTFSDRGFQQPRWSGEPLDERTILLWPEQGLGDTLHFVRYAAVAKRRGGRVIVECQPALKTILGGCPFVDQIVTLGSALPGFDVHAPLLSLPGILEFGEAELFDKPYLFADSSLVTWWRDDLANTKGYRIGICWRGNPQHMFDAQRSFPLPALAPVAAVPGVRLISLQKGAGQDELAAAGFEVIDLGPALDEAAGPFMDTAAVMQCLDRVITCDTAIAHLAGGLGVPVWLALSAQSDWRWMADRQDTPWYPSMRLFRQQQLGQWDDVFQEMAGELQKLAT